MTKKRNRQQQEQTQIPFGNDKQKIPGNNKEDAKVTAESSGVQE
jgi:hypothetical protein